MSPNEMLADLRVAIGDPGGTKHDASYLLPMFDKAAAALCRALPPEHLGVRVETENVTFAAEDLSGSYSTFDKIQASAFTAGARIVQIIPQCWLTANAKPSKQITVVLSEPKDDIETNTYTKSSLTDPTMYIQNNAFCYYTGSATNWSHVVQCRFVTVPTAAFAASGSEYADMPEVLHGLMTQIALVHLLISEEEETLALAIWNNNVLPELQLYGVKLQYPGRRK